MVMPLQKQQQKLMNRSDPFVDDLHRLFFDEFDENHWHVFWNEMLKPPANWEEGDYHTRDGTRLRYVFSSCANPKGLIMLLQGRAQSAHEYYDFIRRSHAEGYVVVTFDRRSHGQSDSFFIDGRTDHHIPDIMQQIQDVKGFISDVVKPSNFGHLSRALVGHSMGGAEGLIALKDHSIAQDFSAAVYLAPMWAINLHDNRVFHHGLRIISPAIFNRQKRLGGMENRVLGRKPWSLQIEKDVFAARKTDDKVGQALQASITALGLARQVGVPTYGTAYEILKLTKQIQHLQFYRDGTKIPSLSLLATNDLANDTHVLTRLSERFGMETHIMPGRHQTLNEVRPIRDSAYVRIFNFLKRHL